MDLRKHLSWDKLIFGVTGVAGALIGLLDFLQVIEWPAETYIKIILLGTGLLMVTVVIESLRGEQVLDRMAERAGISPPKYLDMDAEVPGAFERSVRGVEKSINEAVLTWTVMSNQDRRDRYRNERDKRLTSGEITVRQLVVIHHPQHFEEVVHMLERFRNHNRYELRYYEPAADAMPALSVWSFDERHTYAGSFYVGAPPGADEMLFVTDEHLNKWLLNYWHELWAQADIVKQGLQVHDAKMRNVANRLGISEANFNQLVADGRAAATGKWQNGKLVVSP